MSSSPTTPAVETILAPRFANADRVPATSIRSTILLSSFRAIDALGRRDDYFLALPIEYHDTIEALVSGQWTDMRVAMAHYGAIESLGLSREQAYKNGRQVAERIQQSLVATIARTLTAGATPWTALGRFQSMWDRLLVGGDGAVYKLGPKDARVECLGIPLARFEYVTYGWAGMFASTLELITPRVHVEVDRALSTADSIVYRVSWV